MKCPNCGKGISDSARFCNYCGQPVAVSPAPAAPPANQAVSPEASPARKKKGIPPAAILAGIMVVCCLAGAAIGLGKRGPSVDQSSSPEVPQQSEPSGGGTSVPESSGGEPSIQEPPADTAPAVSAEPEEIPEEILEEMTPAPYNLQQILVETSGSTAELYLYQWIDGFWECLLETPAYIGSNGITTNKTEGDHCTPAGQFNLLFAFCDAPINTGLKAVSVRSDSVWVDDPDSAYYNTLQSDSASYKDWKSAERIYSKFSKGTSSACICFDFNGDCESANSASYKGGSALFIDGVTASGNMTSGYGDIKISSYAMIDLLRLLDAQQNPIIIIE